MDFNMFRIPPVIRIEIPALEAYVAFLREDRQKEIEALDTNLTQSTKDLKGAIDASK